VELGKIYNEDCLEGMKRIPDGSVDMILCDLPYGTTQNKWDSVIPLEPLWEQYERVIKDNGVIALTAQTPFDKVLGASNLKRLKYEWIWEKEAGTGFLNAKKMPLKKHENILIFYDDVATAKGKSAEFQKLRDYFLDEKQRSGMTTKDITKVLGNAMGSHYFTKGVQWTLPTKANYEKLQSTGHFNEPYEKLQESYRMISERVGGIRYNPQMVWGKTYTSKYSSKNLGSENYGDSELEGEVVKTYGHRFPTSILKINRDRDKLHPTQKPVVLFEYLIKTYTNEGETVLDNCMGSGTTAIAAINTNRNYIGFELDETYYNMAIERIEKHTKEWHHDIYT